MKMMMSISSMYTSMMNHFNNQSSYYQSQKTQSKNQNNVVYDYFNQSLTDKRNAQMEKGMEKVTARLERQVANTKKQQEALASTKELSGNLTEKMSTLKAAADRLKNTSFSSVLKPVGFGSQNENVASVVSGAGKNQSSIHLKVNQLATKQMTNFQSMDSAAKDVLKGESSMKLTVNGQEKTVRFNIAEGMNTQDALKSMMTTINQANLGVKASVTQVDGKSILSMISNETGKNQSFQVDFTGKPAEQMKVQSTIDARDASYTVNGQTQTSATNQVKIPTDHTELTVNLKGTGETALSKASMDTSKVVSSMKDFINAYNDAVDFVGENKRKSSALAALSQSFSYRSLGSSGLRAVGIEVDAKGKLSLNEGQFVNTLKNNPKQVEKTVGSYNGLAGVASSKAQGAMILSNNLVNNHSSASSSTYNLSGQAVGLFYNMVV